MNTHVSENASFHKKINADQSHGWFWAHFQLVLDCRKVPNQYARFEGENENYLHRKFSAETSPAKSKNVHNFSLFEQIIAKLGCVAIFVNVFFYAWKLHDIL